MLKTTANGEALTIKWSFGSNSSNLGLNEVGGVPMQKPYDSMGFGDHMHFASYDAKCITSHAEILKYIYKKEKHRLNTNNNKIRSGCPR
jgi:hypothetical protein